MIIWKRGLREGDYICRVFYQGKSKWKIISRLRSRCTFLEEKPWNIESVRIGSDIIKRFEPWDITYYPDRANNVYVATSNQIFVHALQRRLYYLEQGT
jgi:hypothetical protein